MSEDARIIRVPDIGDFDEVDVIEVHVAEGDEIAAEDPIVTLETDKASMDLPAPRGGRVEAVLVKTGDKVSEGSELLRLADAADEGEDAPSDGGESGESDTDEARTDEAEVAGAEDEAEAGERDGQASGSDKRSPRRSQARQAARDDADADLETDLVVLGAGPGGYAAAFRAADLGLRVTLVERWPVLGGVCLNVGCIPSKALLHAARVIEEAADMGEHGIRFGEPEIDAARLGEWKSGVVERLTDGLTGLAKQRKVQVVHGTGRFLSPHRLAVENDDGRRVIAFEQCVIAAGSEPSRIPGLPDDERIVDSTGALELAPLPERLLVVGGGIIGLEMACVYDALGVKVTVVELMKQLMPGADPDLVRPLAKRMKSRYEDILLGVSVSGMESRKEGVRVSFEGDGAPEPGLWDRVLVAVGRRANGDRLDADKAGVEVGERGIIPVDKQMRTNVPHIYAIGDIVGQPMLAHKATHEGKVAAEAAAGEKSAFDARVIPSVAYTDPEVAWVGLTETEAKEQGVDYGKAQFPWAASGRSLAMGRDEGFTKLLFDKSTNRLLGAGIVGTNAGDLISETALAIEMDADAADIGLTIHPHPTLSETVAMAAEAWEGTLTDLYMPRRKDR
ncbi:dihydrolipoyl dehydrogenase [Lentisalinibacter orientalis]|uniref:dihydrolipoyl dehydrogenase n=1 Tax=Lentisalinibacter orientalis TaxID=2992241 RepID=UPI00386779A9